MPIGKNQNELERLNLGNDILITTIVLTERLTEDASRDPEEIEGFRQMVEAEIGHSVDFSNTELKVTTQLILEEEN